MATKITKSQVRAGGQSDTAYTLENDSSKLTVWPAFGFNALEWKIRYFTSCFLSHCLAVLFQVVNLQEALWRAKASGLISQGQK